MSFRVGDSENECWNKNQHPWDTLCANFYIKRTTLTYWAQICPKMDLGSEFQKSKTGFGISTSKIPCEPIFSQDGQLWISWPKFGKITQLRAIFWFDVIVEGVAESWVEVDGAEWRRMELGGAGWRWMVLGRGGWIWMEVDEAGWSWVEVNGAGWNWVHGLVITLS